MNYMFQGANRSDGKAAERREFKALCDEMWRGLTEEEKARIEGDPMCAEAEAFYTLVGMEFESGRRGKG